MRQTDKLVQYGLLRGSEAEEVEEVNHLLGDEVILCKDCEGELRNCAARLTENKCLRKNMARL